MRVYRHARCPSLVGRTTALGPTGLSAPEDRLLRELVFLYLAGPLSPLALTAPSWSCTGYPSLRALTMSCPGSQRPLRRRLSTHGHCVCGAGLQLWVPGGSGLDFCFGGRVLGQGWDRW